MQLLIVIAENLTPSRKYAIANLIKDSKKKNIIIAMSFGYLDEVSFVSARPEWIDMSNLMV